MTRRSSILSFCIVLVVGSGLGACGQSESSEGEVIAGDVDAGALRVVAFNPGLGGNFSEFYQERRAPVIEAVANFGQDLADVMCVVEIGAKEDIEEIRQRAQQNGLHVADFEDEVNSATPAGDPRDQKGNVPVPPDYPPCMADDPENPGGDRIVNPAFEMFMECAQEKCAATPGDPNSPGMPAGFGSCLAGPCLVESGGMWNMNASWDTHRCWQCALANLASNKTIQETRDICTNDSLAGHSWDGRLQTMVLSHLKFVADDPPEFWVLPSTGTRRGLIRAPVELNNGAVVDVYCGHINIPLDGVRPYTGAYGGTATSQGNQWIEEQKLQAQRTIEWVQERSGRLGRRAVIAGTWFAGPTFAGVKGDPKHPKLDMGEAQQQIYNTLWQAMPPATPEGFVPVCTECGDNPIFAPPGRDPGSSSWTTHIFLSGISQSDVQSADVVFDGPSSVQVTPSEGEPYAIPLSSHYGFRSTINISK